jgi:hypothetical protein
MPLQNNMLKLDMPSHHFYSQGARYLPHLEFLYMLSASPIIDIDSSSSSVMCFLRYVDRWASNALSILERQVSERKGICGDSD